MISRETNPDFLNSFLDYSITILNKSPNSIKEYNYDLNMFLRFMMQHFNITSEKDFNNINIKDFTVDVLKQITLDDIHSFISYLAINQTKQKHIVKVGNTAEASIFNKYSKERFISYAKCLYDLQINGAKETIKHRDWKDLEKSVLKLYE